jgi:hypothetical protein
MKDEVFLYPADRGGVALLPDEPTAGKLVDEGSVEFARPELGSHHKKRVAA